MQGPVPEQAPPLHPAKTDPAAGTAATDINVPPLKELEHVLPQLMPAGLLEMVPVPVPVADTAKV